MKSDGRTCRNLVDTGAFKDLEKPVILTSGELGIYYCNTEKLCLDDGEFNKYGDSSKDMINHAWNLYQNLGHRPFQDTVDTLVEKVSKLFDEEYICAVSGGQRRDWLFSGPVAKILDVPHISLYKQKHGKDDNIEMVLGDEVIPVDDLSPYQIIHIVDLITEGSSIYREEDGAAKGWVPMIKNKEGKVDNLIAVVTRNQGGEDNLAKQGVAVNSLVSIDEEFLKNYSKYSERAVEYFANPQRWSEKFLQDDELDCLLPFFDPAGEKLDRAKKFIDRYKVYMSLNGSYDKLDKKVKKEYCANLNDIFGGK